jgi:hypothetical protein
MRKNKIALTLLAGAVVLAASASSAEARWYRHRGPGPVLGLVGGVIVGAATIATLPFRIVGDAFAGPGYYGPGPYSYGPPEPVSGYGYNPGDGGNYGPPPPPPSRYYRNYGPPPGYYGGYGNGY